MAVTIPTNWIFYSEYLDNIMTEKFAANFPKGYLHLGLLQSVQDPSDRWLLFHNPTLLDLEVFFSGKELST